MKTVLTGCSCCFKSSIGEWIDSDILQFIPSDSAVLSTLRSMNLMNWDYRERLLNRWTTLMQLPSYNDYLIERSLIDQLVFAKIASTGWFDAYENLNYEPILKRYDDYLKLESDIGISKYIILMNVNKKFIDKLTSDPSFEDSKRADTFLNYDQYVKLQADFVALYRDAIQTVNSFRPDGKEAKLTVVYLPNLDDVTQIIKETAPEVINLIKRK